MSKISYSNGHESVDLILSIKSRVKRTTTGTAFSFDSCQSLTIQLHEVATICFLQVTIDSHLFGRWIGTTRMDDAEKVCA